MTSPPPPRHHHYIPAFYLAGFTADGARDGTLVVTDLDDKRQYPASPKKTGKERDFYAVDSTNGDGAIVEKWLADYIDGPAAKALAKTIEAGKMLEPDDPDYEWLLIFVASMLVRGRYFRDRINDFEDRLAKRRLWNIGHDDEAFKRFVESIPEEKRQKVEGGFDEHKLQELLKSADFTVSLRNTPLVKLMLEVLADVAAMLIARKWTLGTSIELGSHFVTSDFPVSCHANDPKNSLGAGYGMTETTVFFPLTRLHAIVGTFEGDFKPKVCTRNMVALVNTATAFQAFQYVYSPTDEVLWFDEKKQTRGTADLYALWKKPTTTPANSTRTRGSTDSEREVPMSDCPLYRTTANRIARNPIHNPDRRPPRLQLTQIPWCAHPKHSPVDEETATGVAGGARLLKCGGERARCPLTDEKYEDQ